MAGTEKTGKGKSSGQKNVQKDHKQSTKDYDKPSNFLPVLRYVGSLMMVLSAMALLSLPVVITFDEFFALPAFISTAVVAFIPGFLLYYYGQKFEEPSLYQIFWMAALAWLVIALIGSLPFVVIGHHFEDQAGLDHPVARFTLFTNAFFESMSGFTSTGLTMIMGAESQLPASLQWWRSFTQWIGGLGVISLVLMYIQPTFRAALAMDAELSNQELHKNANKMARHIWLIYLLYSVIAIALLWLSGMAIWPAVNYGLTGIATGGFGITDNSMGDFSRLTQWLMIFIMIMGALNFASHDRLFHCRPKDILGDKQFLWFLAGIPVLFFTLWSTSRLAGSDTPFSDLAFQGISAAATAGLSTTDVAHLPPATFFILIAAMVIGACKGSTAGGIKVNRVRHLILIGIDFVRYMRSQPDILFTIRGGEIERDYPPDLYQALALGVIWILTLILGTLALATVAPQTPLGHSFFEAASALGCVGLSSGLTSPDLSAGGKYILIALMWLGRLEIIPILAFVFAPFYREVKESKNVG